MTDRRAHLADRDLYRTFYDADMAPGVVMPMVSYEPRLQWALDHIGPDDDVIDIGCHKGEMTRYFPTLTDGQVVGVDISVRAIRDAAFAKPRTRIQWYAAEAEALPFEDDSFDVAILAEILEHVPDVAAVLREAERVVRPGGRVVISVPRDALAIDEADRPDRVELLGYDLDMHVREFVPEVELAGKPGLVTREASITIPDQTPDRPAVMGFRLAAYTVEKAS